MYLWGVIKRPMTGNTAQENRLRDQVIVSGLRFCIRYTYSDGKMNFCDNWLDCSSFYLAPKLLSW